MKTLSKITLLLLFLVAALQVQAQVELIDSTNYIYVSIDGEEYRGAKKEVHAHVYTQDGVKKARLTNMIKTNFPAGMLPDNRKRSIVLLLSTVTGLSALEAEAFLNGETSLTSSSAGGAGLTPVQAADLASNSAFRQNLQQEVRDTSTASQHAVSEKAVAVALEAIEEYEHPRDSRAMSGTIDADLLLAEVEDNQAYLFHAVFGELTFTSALEIAMVVDGLIAIQGAVEPLVVPNGTQGYLTKNNGSVTVHYTTKYVEPIPQDSAWISNDTSFIRRFDGTVDIIIDDDYTLCEINHYIHDPKPRYYLHASHEGDGGVTMTFNVNGAPATFTDLLNATDNGSGVVSMSNGINSNFNRRARLVQVLQDVGDYVEVSGINTSPYDGQFLSISTDSTKLSNQASDDFRFNWSRAASSTTFRLLDNTNTAVYTGGGSGGVYRIERTLTGFKYSANGVSIYEESCDSTINYQGFKLPLDTSGISSISNPVISINAGGDSLTLVSAASQATPLNRQSTFDVSNITASGTTLNHNAGANPAQTESIVNDGTVVRIGTQAKITFDFHTDDDDPIVLDLVNALPAGVSILSVSGTADNSAEDPHADVGLHSPSATQISINRANTIDDDTYFRLSVWLEGYPNLEEYTVSNSNSIPLSQSPDGNCWQIGVDNAGNLTTTSVPCN